MYQPALASDTRLEIRSTFDVVVARQQGRELALDLGFAEADVTLIAAAISEIARNILDHAKRGAMLFNVGRQTETSFLEIIAEDQGPGIADVTRVLQCGFSNQRIPGTGLPGVKRMMDEFEINSTPGMGTKVVMRKWTKYGNR